MSNTLHLRSLLIVSASAAALTSIASPAWSQSIIEELVVTAQRREEALQDVPIAVSAFDQGALEAQKIDGGPNLVQAVPNVSFSKTNFTGYNFTVRGIGSKAIAASGDAGTGIHLNNAPLLANRLFEAEFYDVERVEVLRGPQGTLYGRNATGGVVNIITAKPSDVFEGYVRGEIGNYDTKKVRGAINIPMGEGVALRLAGSYLKRSGFGDNLTLGNDSDDRDLYAYRATLAVNPFDGLRATLYYEHFEEDDKRARVGKQLCAKDLGPTSVGGVPVLNPIARGLQSQGCRNTSIYDPASLGTLNTIPTLGGVFGLLNGVLLTDAYAGKTQNPDLRSIESAFDPIYQAKEDVFQVNIELDLTEGLTLSSLSSFTKDELFTFQDYNRIVAVTPFSPPPALAPLFNNGNFFNDPQVGNSNLFRTFDVSASQSEAFSHELRLQSSFDGPLNFNVGALYLTFDTDTDYFVFSNTLTIAAATGVPIPGRFIDPNFPPTGEGHNYYINRTPYSLKSMSVFGEVYWQVLDNLKITGGLRRNKDEKNQIILPVTLTIPGRGFEASGTKELSATFKETTGRLGFDWKPDLGFTNDTLIYGFYSRGYKPGGLNPPCSAAIACPAETFDPEFVKAYELGAKNALLDGSLILNLSAFHYDYSGYQISKIVNRNSVNENIDAKIKGLEVESIWEPVRNLRFNATFGLLDTEIQGDQSVDTINRTQGNPALSFLSGTLAGSNCVVPTAQLAAFNAAANATPAAAPLLLTACAGSLRTGTTAATGNPLAPFGIFLDPQDGVPVQLAGKELPNSPKNTFNIGAQYTFEFGGNWAAMARVDYYRQAKSFARIFNGIADEIDAYENVNFTVRIDNEDLGLTIEGFVKNATDEEAITDIYITDDSSGLFRNIFLTEPRTYGLAISKSF
jgi:outer membrane receptor protein involved in Fe transport